MVNKKTIEGIVQPSLFPCQGTGVNDAKIWNNPIPKLSTYLKTRDGLWRLLATFPGNMPVEEAVRLAPSILTKNGKEVVGV